VLVHGRLPHLAALDPYRLGATPSAWGNTDTCGHDEHDEHVPAERMTCWRLRCAQVG
jgi:hypothetical protein